MGMASRNSSRDYHANMLPLSQRLDGPCLSMGRSALRTSVSACRCHDGYLQCGLVRYMQWAGSLGVLDRASTALAHELPRVAGSATSHVAVLAAAAWQARVGPHGQHFDSFLKQLAGLSTITSHDTAHPPSPPLESDAVQVAACHPHPGGAQSCSQCALTTAHVPRRMATPSWDDLADLESIRGSSGRPVCLPRVLLYDSLTEAPLVQTHWHTAGLWLYASMHSPVSLPAQALCKVRENEEQVLLVCAVLAHPYLVFGTHAPGDSPSLAHASEQGPSFSEARHHWHLRPDHGTRQT